MLNPAKNPVIANRAALVCMMKKIFQAFFLIFLTVALNAQTTFVSNFEGVILPDYHNQVYNDSTSNAGGFHNGHAFFPTFWNGSWKGGWVASAMHDSSTAGIANQYGCAAFKGYNNSNIFAVGTTQNKLTLRLTDSLIGKNVSGFYVCNSTYAYKSMKYGSTNAKKFGDTTGTHCACAQGSYPDWFKLTIKRYYNDTLRNDTAEVYLADFRYANTSQDYILNTWTWINLSTLGGKDSLLGRADSLEFYLSSSDNGTSGMNTPPYFCIDNLTLSTVTLTAVENYTEENTLNVYPNPANNFTEIVYSTPSAVYVSMKIIDVTGREMAAQNMRSFTGINKFKIDVSAFPAGVYYVILNKNGSVLTRKLITQ